MIAYADTTPMRNLREAWEALKIEADRLNTIATLSMATDGFLHPDLVLELLSAQLAESYAHDIYLKETRNPRYWISVTI